MTPVLPKTKLEEPRNWTFSWAKIFMLLKKLNQLLFGAKRPDLKFCKHY